MKKSLYFYALFALCCIFIFKADVSYATDMVQSTNFDVSSAGIFTQTDFTSGGTCYYQWNFPAYGETPTHQGGSGMSCTGFSLDLEALTSGIGDGQYWVWVWKDYGAYWYYYTPIYRTGGVWSFTPPPLVPIITITAPTTGATITSTATTLDGNWDEIDPAIYKNITLYFNSNFIGEQSVAKIISITNATGSFSFPLSDFGISANGQWDLKGNATFKNTQLSDMYITPDIISPSGYNLIFNVSGFHTPYTFTDFDTWYDANVSNYDSPSTWASGMIGYLQPILEKIAEFGARLQDYLDTSTAYQRGNDIGSVFPVVNAYILKINIFFGGFPIAQFFQWGILIMIGMFAIKIILKLLSFIPVIGGGG